MWNYLSNGLKCRETNKIWICSWMISELYLCISQGTGMGMGWKYESAEIFIYSGYLNLGLWHLNTISHSTFQSGLYCVFVRMLLANLMIRVIPLFIYLSLSEVILKGSAFLTKVRFPADVRGQTDKPVSV